jgi:hypothetical protein
VGAARSLEESTPWRRKGNWSRFLILWIKVEVTRMVLLPVAITSVRTTCTLGRTAYQFARRHCHAFYLKYGLDLKCLIGYSAPFVCDCCCVRLDRREMDTGYRQSCYCAAGGSVQYCFQCVRTFLEGQVTVNQATQLVCMATRQCPQRPVKFAPHFGEELWFIRASHVPPMPSAWRPPMDLAC